MNISKTLHLKESKLSQTSQLWIRFYFNAVIYASKPHIFQVFLELSLAYLLSYTVCTLKTRKCFGNSIETSISITYVVFYYSIYIYLRPDMFFDNIIEPKILLSSYLLKMWTYSSLLFMNNYYNKQDLSFSYLSS